MFRFTLRPPAKRLWCPYVHPQPEPPLINHPNLKIRHFKKIWCFKSTGRAVGAGVLRPATCTLSRRPCSKTTPNPKNWTYKNAGVLRPPAVQSVQGCSSRLHTPPVTAPVQKLPLTLKIGHIKKMQVFYVPQPCSRCRGVAQGYIHPQSPPPFKNHP